MKNIYYTQNGWTVSHYADKPFNITRIEAFKGGITVQKNMVRMPWEGPVETMERHSLGWEQEFITPYYEK